MKLLFDPIYTSYVSRCASAFKFAQVWEYMAARDPDLYAYWLVPEGLTEEEQAWLDRLEHVDRIRFVPFDTHGILDRYKHYTRMTFELELVYSFCGDYWDWDICVTNKAALVPLIRMIAVKPMQHSYIWSKQIVLLEDMPLMSIKDGMPIAPGAVSDQQTILGYLQADQVLMCGFWQKPLVLREAKRYFAPAMLRDLDHRITGAVPRTFTEVGHKTRATVQRIVDRDKPFTISFSGRMVLGHHFDDIFDVMSRHWIMRNDDAHPVKCVVTTASKGKSGKIRPPDFVDVVMAPREEFWRIVKEEADVGVFFSEWEDYSLSLIEPIAMGLPVAVKHSASSESMLGAQYPFYVRNAKEAYGVVRAFYEDYATNYQRFVAWQREHFRPLLESREPTWVGYQVEAMAQQWWTDLQAWGENKDHENQFVGKMAPYFGTGNTIIEALRAYDGETGEVQNLDEKYYDQRCNRRVVMATDWNVFRLQLIAKRGLRDAGSEVGCLKDPAA